LCRIRPYWIKAAPLRGTASGAPRAGLSLGRPARRAPGPTRAGTAIISDDYFDERIVQETELAEPEDTTRENILAEAGYEQVYDIDEIITRMPTPAEINRLRISTGTPLPSSSEPATPPAIVRSE